MALEIEVTTVDDNGEEIVYMLPAKYEVCRKCLGHGSHLNPSIGEHCYSLEEFEQEFSEPESRDAYFRRGGMYDVKCETCRGKRVVPVVDREACTSPEEIAGLKALDKQRRDDAEYEQLVRSELAFGC